MRFLAVLVVLCALLTAPDARAQVVWVKQNPKISETSGGFGTGLDPVDVFGASVARLGDLDGDGVTDIAVGAPWDDDGIPAATDRGAVWILLLNANGSVKAKQKISAAPGSFPLTLDAGDNLGSSVAGLGDFDGDGVGDLAVGSAFDDDGGTGRGAIYLLMLNANGTVKTAQTISASAGGFGVGLDNNDNFGASVAALGDVNGDGTLDLAVGAPGDDDGGADRGAVYVLFLQPDGDVDSKTKLSDTAGGFLGVMSNSDLFGWSVAALGRLDAGAVPDLAVGAPGDDDGGTDRGAVWMLLLTSAGAVQFATKLSDTTPSLANPALDNSDQFGYALAGLGDVDGDQVPDLAVGAPFDDDGSPDAGAVWIARLRSNGAVDEVDKLSATSGAFAGTLTASAFFGNGIAALGDLDGDGRGDLAVGSPGDGDGGPFQGAVWPLLLRTVLPTASPDADDDGAADAVDNCRATANADQADADGDGIGDVCEGCGNGAIACFAGAISTGQPSQDFTVALDALPARPVLIATAQPTGSLPSFLRVSIVDCTAECNFASGMTFPNATPRDTQLVDDLYRCYTNAAARAGQTCDIRVTAGDGQQGPFTLRVDGVTHAPPTKGTFLSPLVEPAGFVDASLLTFIGEGNNFRWLHPGTPALGQCVLDNFGNGQEGTDIHYTPTGVAGWDCCTFRFDGMEGTSSDVGQVIAQIPPLTGPPPDADLDGFLDPCDSCRYRWNETQDDADENGRGDACECGEVTGDGLLGTPDVSALRIHLATPGGTLGSAALQRCSVFPGAGCDVLDVVVLRRSLAGRAPGVLQVCAATAP